MLKTVFRRLFYGGTATLRQYEAACLELVKDVLSDEGRSILEQQIASIGLVQRFSQDRLVTLHFLEMEEAIPLFANRSDECRAVRMLVRPKTARGLLSVDVVFHRGRLSSLEYKKPPGVLSEEAFTLDSIELREDLLHAEREPERLVQPVGALLQAIQRHVPVDDIVAPASEARVSAFLEVLGTVPGDYAALLHETDGFSVKGWRFTGTKARRLLLHNDLWLVAETAQNAFALREDATEPTVLFLDQINDECSPIGATFVEAFLKVLSANASSED